MGVAAILVMWPGPFVSIWNLSLIGPVVSEEKMIEIDDRWTDGRTDDVRQSDWYTFSSPMSLRLRWAKNTEMSI